jgi:hypothetical protein
VLQSGNELLRHPEWLREPCAAAVRAAFEGAPLKRFPRISYAISRARQGSDCNPVYRLSTWCVALRRARQGRERAQQLVDALQATVDALWPASDECLEVLSLREQRADTLEDVHQLAHAQGERGAAALWLEALERRQAVSAVLIARLRVECATEVRA